MKFLVDEQLLPALARFLAAKGFECQHVRNTALERASDRQTWNFAVTGGWIVISKDAEFLAHAVRSEVGWLLWVRLGNCRTRPLLEAFERGWMKIQERFEEGERVVEFYGVAYQTVMRERCELISRSQIAAVLLACR